MQLTPVPAREFPAVRAFYDAVIDETAGMERHACWKKGSHPFDEDILSYMERGELYGCRHEDEWIAMLALPLYQDEDYRAVDWAVAAADDEVATLHLFAVAPSFQKNGVGKRLVTLAVEKAQRAGKRALRLDVMASNLPAIKLYTALGFSRRGRQRLYTDTVGWTDFYFYEKLLSTADRS